VEVIFSTFPPAVEYIKADKLRALGVTTATRFEGAPNIPAIGEVVAGYEGSQWYGVAAPKNASPDIIQRLNKEIDAILNDPNIRARIADLGGTPLLGSPADFAKLIADETEKWGKVIRAANIKPD
jgi:tripartite-type tricarboxylate transporter receptor subunit TctC